MESLKIGFIGLGMMGKPMAMRLLQSGFSLRVYNKTQEKAAELLRRSAEWCESPRVLMEKSEVVISMVSDSQALMEIASSENGLLAGVAPGKVHIDMSTVLPLTTQYLEQAYRGKQALFLHAPVLGSVPQATDGSLLIFVGGDRTAAAQCASVFNSLGGHAWYFDDVTKASHLKLICNLFIASMITVLSEGLVFGQKVGLTSTTILEVLKESALGAPMYQTKGGAIRRRDFTPHFLVAHMFKDVNLILEAARSVGVSLPAVEVIRELFHEAVTRGYGGEDYSAVIKVFEERAHAEVRS